ncbi:MAG TPA: tetratricopeptide repeat protein [Candidatus Acidoferrum sp.]|nr:tetratricopeptide repeat protein [Candidatus Acidoferrum sp.]
MRSLAAAALLVLVAAGSALAQPARERALAELGRGNDVAARRTAAQQLADSGVMADLPALAAALRDPDPLVRGFVESAMWSVWSRSGAEDIDRLFAIGVEQMSQRQLDAAVETFSRVIQRRPEFAEGWNKRATVYYLLGDYRHSLADCDEVMARNPYHWGALSGYGMIYMQLDQPARAIEYLERALAVNPNLDQVAQTIEVLKTLLLQRRRDMI